MPNNPLALALEERRRQALLAGDLPVLQGLLADDLVYVHSTGASDRKDSYLAKLASGSLQYLALDFSELQTQSLQLATVVSGRMSAVVRKDGQEKNVASLFMTVWGCDRDGVWRLHAHQGTPLPPR
jgi:hypothetical protein